MVLLGRRVQRRRVKGVGFGEIHTGIGLEKNAPDGLRSLGLVHLSPTLLGRSSKLDSLFQKNLNETKEELKKINS